MQLTAAVEANSRHPIGEAIVADCRRRFETIDECTSFISHEGKGVGGVVHGRRIVAGNRTLMKEAGIEIYVVAARAEQFESRGMTVVFCAAEGKCIGCIGLADTLKEGAREAVAVLGRMGIECGIVSGDNHRSVSAVGAELGIDNVLAEVLPQDKANKIKNLQQAGKRVAFAGDGINDAPALAQADVGIAFGNGTDIAMETGDIVLVKGDPRDVAAALQLGRKLYRRIRGNLFWAFAYNMSLIPLAAGLLWPFFRISFKPEFAALAMAFSSVTVVTRSLMLRRFTPDLKGKGEDSGKRTPKMWE
jgi:Cu+-exporting ATPase